MNFKKMFFSLTVFALLAMVILVPVKKAEAFSVFNYYENYQSNTTTQANFQINSYFRSIFNWFNNGTEPTTNNVITKENTKSPEPATPAQPDDQVPDQPSQSSNDYSQVSIYEQRVVELVNVEREKAGLQPLKVDAQLSRVARLKSEDMRDNNYFSHNSPTYGSPFDMMQNYGINYRTAGENIAAGQKTPEDVVNAWMNSSGHRANILNANFTHIGVGLAEGGSYGTYWTQEFIGK